MSLKAGELLNNERYQILRLLSDAGGMGVVYEGLDCNLDDKVVVKQSRFNTVESLRHHPNYCALTETQLQEEIIALRKDFEREAKMLSRLRHSALPRVRDYFKTIQGEQFLVMELIPGEDLEELLQKKRPAPEQVLDWAQQILEALHYLHTAFDEPIMHRDIKPKNLMLMPSGQIVLLDFGLAKGAPTGMSVSGVSVPGSSPIYSPLEQIEGNGTDVRSDLYALAVTLHHLLTRQKPPGAGTRAMSLVSKRPDPLRPVCELVPQATTGIAAWLTKAAALHQEDRFESAAAMQKALAAARSSSTSQAALPAVPQTPTQPLLPTPSPTHQRNRFEVPLTPNFATSPPPQPARPVTSVPKPAVADKLGVAARFSENLNGATLEMVLIPGGKFLMGSPKGTGYDSERPQHEVSVPAFYCGKYQVTQAQWQAVMGNNPSHFKGDLKRPVETISWEEAQAFCKKLSTLTGKTYRLPSEAEWEYACRAGTTGDCTGELEAMAWYWENASGTTHPVGQKQANKFELYDMHGNVWEWCEDVWHKDYNGAPTDGSAWLSGGDASRRVLRGGSWINYGAIVRSANRNRVMPSVRNNNFGLRVVVSARTPDR
jgi:eukaryotic-like serine/threonine-protein kinase